MVAIESNIYIFGGHTYGGVGGYLDDFYKIETNDTNTYNSTKIELQSSDSSNIPSARRDHSMVAIGSNIYIFGGYNGADYNNDLYKINIRIILDKKRIFKEIH